MNPIELFTKEGKSVERWYCGKCGIIYISKELALQCCDTYKCRKCDKETGGRMYLVCDSCRAIERVEIEKKRFNKAQKLTNYTGPVFLEGFPYDNGYAGSLDEMLELWNDNEDEPFPEYVWACIERRFVNVDVGDITEMFDGEAYEDWEPSSLDGLDELKVALEKFCEANIGQVAWEPDYTRAVLVKAEDIKP